MFKKFWISFRLWSIIIGLFMVVVINNYNKSKMSFDDLVKSSTAVYTDESWFEKAVKISGGEAETYVSSSKYMLYEGIGGRMNLDTEQVVIYNLLSEEAKITNYVHEYMHIISGYSGVVFVNGEIENSPFNEGLAEYFATKRYEPYGYESVASVSYFGYQIVAGILISLDDNIEDIYFSKCSGELQKYFDSIVYNGWYKELNDAMLEKNSLKIELLLIKFYDNQKLTDDSYETLSSFIELLEKTYLLENMDK